MAERTSTNITEYDRHSRLERESHSPAPALPALRPLDTSAPHRDRLLFGRPSLFPSHRVHFTLRKKVHKIIPNPPRHKETRLTEHITSFPHREDARHCVLPLCYSASSFTILGNSFTTSSYQMILTPILRKSPSAFVGSLNSERGKKA